MYFAKRRGGGWIKVVFWPNDRDVTSYFKFRIRARPQDFVASWREQG